MASKKLTPKQEVARNLAALEAKGPKILDAFEKSLPGEDKPAKKSKATKSAKKAKAPKDAKPKVAKKAKEKPARKDHGKQPKEVVGFWGFSDSSVIRWMGKHDFSAGDARNVFEAIGRQVNAVTLATELSDGRTGWGNKKPAPLTSEQGKKLQQLKE